MKRRLALLILALASCRESHLQGDLDVLRREMKELESQIPPEAPIWIDAFDRVIEDDGADVPDPIYKHVAKHLAKMTDEEISKQSQGQFPMREALEHPAKFRGKFWKVRGTITRFWPLDADLADGTIAKVFAGILFHQGTKQVGVHVLYKPELIYSKEDVVEFDGLFLKVMEFETKAGGTLRLPFFMARSLRKFY